MDFCERAAQSARRIGFAGRSPRGRPGTSKKPRGIRGFVTKELESVPVKRLAARLGNHVDDAAAGLRELGRSERALNAKLGHRLHQRHDSDGESVAVGVIGAIQDVAVLRGSRAVYGRVERDGAAIALAGR